VSDRVLFCDACGAPLDARAWDAFVLCRYCASTNRVGAPQPGTLPDDGRPRLSVGGRTYVIEGLLARGDVSDVYRARWSVRLGELVVLKVCRSAGDEDLLRREHRILEALVTSADASSASLASRLPQPIALGPVRVSDRERLVAVYRWHSGFLHTLPDIARAHPGGIDDPIVVWVTKRLLELLGFVHRAGVVHGAVLPPHVLVQPRNHGAMLVGFATATRAQGSGRAEPLPAISRAWAAHYGEEARTREVSPATDLAQLARSVKLVARPSLAGELASWLDSLQSQRGSADAWQRRDELIALSRRLYGPGSYHPLAMPGWPSV
jgi:hypothetical protein